MKQIMFIGILLYGLNLFSQNKVFGVVLDEYGYTVEFSTVSILSDKDSTTLIKSTMTNRFGYFTFDDFPLGWYVLKIDVPTYDLFFKTITIQENSRDLGVFELITADEHPNLSIRNIEKGIAIKIKRKTRKSFKTIAAILNQVDFINKNEFGAYTISGHPYTVSINGQDINIDTLLIVDSLSKLETYQFNKVEIDYYTYLSNQEFITIPKPNINLVTTDFATNGWSYGIGVGGNISRSEYYDFKSRGSGTHFLNYTSNKFNLGLDTEVRGMIREFSFKSRLNQFNLNERFLGEQNGNGQIFALNAEGRISLEYKPSKYNLIYFSGGYEAQYSDNNLGSSWSFDNDNKTNVVRLVQLGYFSDERLKYQVLGTYHHLFKKQGQNLKMCFSTESSSSYNSIGNYLTRVVSPTLYDNSSSSNEIFTSEYKSLIEYSHPLSKNGLILTQLTSILRNQDINYRRYVYIVGDNFGNSLDPQNTDHFFYYDDLTSANVMYKNWIYDSSNLIKQYNIGLNILHIGYSGQFRDNLLSFDQNKLKLLPSASLTYYRTKTDSININFKSTINPIHFEVLSPFVDYSNYFHTTYIGNPLLRPETNHDISMSYGSKFKSARYLATAFSRLTQDVIMPITYPVGDGSILTQWQNIKNRMEIGFRGNLTYKDADWWDCSLDFTTYLTHIRHNALKINNTRLTSAARFVYNTEPWKKGRLRLDVNYTSPIALAQGRTYPIYFIDVVLTQSIMRNRGRISLTIKDLLNTQSKGLTIYNDDFKFQQTYKLDTQAIMINFGYTINAKFYDKVIENKFLNDINIYPFQQ